MSFLPARSVCVECPRGRFGVSLGLSECEVCDPGQYQPALATTECINCATGQFQSASTKSTCLPCFTGQYQPSPGQSSCIECARGQYQNSSGSNSSCILCESGRAAPLKNQSICDICSDGYYSAADGDSDGIGVDEEGTVCSICPRGKVAVAEQGRCLDCIPGRYQGKRGRSSCPVCRVGEYQPSSGTSACIECARGQYQNSTASNSSCILCESGRVAPLKNQSICDICADGYYSAADGDSDGIGVDEEGTVCSICPRGKVAVAEQGRCLDCIPGRYQGKRGRSSCPVCRVGEYQPSSGTSVCIECAQGQYQNTTASNSSCILCHTGFFADTTNQSLCEICESGFYSSNDGAGVGDGIGVEEGAVVCSTCPPGTVAQAGRSACGLCEAGQYQGEAGELTCTDCPVGQYQDTVGKSNCTACAAGQYQNSEGSGSSCIPCEAGFFSGSNWSVLRSVCDMCLAGTYSSLVGDTDGDGVTNGAVTCATCPPGMTSFDLQSACDSCAAGKFQPLPGTSRCHDCEFGYYSEVNRTLTACTACPPGRFGLNVTTVTFGNVKPRMATKQDSRDYCQACPDAQFQTNEAQSECVECPTGFRCTQKGMQPVFVDQSLCSTCIAEGRFFGDQLCWHDGDSDGFPYFASAFFEPGRDRDSDGVEDAHQIRDTGYGRGEFGISDALYKCTCSEHYGGYYCDEDYDDCISAPCTNGATCVNLGDFAGNFRCDCASGWEGTLCERPQDLCAADPCGIVASAVPPLDSIVVSRAASCRNVPANYSTDGGSFGVTSYECTCRPGFIGIGSAVNSEKGATTCRACEFGKFIDTFGASVCVDCPAGRFNFNKSGVLSTCEACSPGHSCAAANLNQSACAPGQFQPKAGQTECLRCQPGYFIPHWASADTECVACPSGKYAVTSAASYCTACPPGYMCPNTTEQPIPCVPGYFAAEQAQSECAACANGTFSVGFNATFCSSCPPGSQCACASTPPGLCAPGVIQPQNMSTNCLECAPGWFNSGTGSSVCDICSPGFFCPNRTSILPCPSGKYQNGFNASLCLDCASGRFSRSNASFCIDCPVGHECPVASQLPLPCKPGMFQNDTQQTTCEVCAAGYYAHQNSTVTCVQCPVGHRCSDPTRVPEQCALGRYQDKPGSTKCETCPVGRYHGYATPGEDYVLVGLVPTEFGDNGTEYPDGTPAANNGSCPPCMRHHYCPFAGMTEAIPCPDKTSTFDISLPNGGAARVGLTECIGCPETQVDGCALCIAGKYCTPDGDAPDCAPGYFADVGDLTECKACEPGQFQNEDGTTACKVCDFATLVSAGEPESVVSVPTQASFYPFLYSNITAATLCNRVEGGYRCQYATGTETCDPAQEPTPCLAGTYRAEEMFSPSDPKAAGKCVACGEGQFSNADKATQCVDCPPGYFQHETGQTACVPCGLNNTKDPGGDYQEDWGETECVLCEKGKYQNQTAATACVPCKSDFSEYADREGLTQCIPCPEGQECLVVTSSPTLCAVGTYSDVTCKPCTPGFYTDEEGKLTCSQCQVRLAWSLPHVSCATLDLASLSCCCCLFRLAATRAISKRIFHVARVPSVLSARTHPWTLNHVHQEHLLTPKSKPSVNCVHMASSNAITTPPNAWSAIVEGELNFFVMRIALHVVS